MFIAIGLIFLVIYALIVFYIGWSGWSWMKSSVSRRFRLVYIISLVFLASSFILARVFEGSFILNWIGSYWLAIFSLLVLILPVVHLIVWLTKLTSLPRHHVQRWSGIITLTALVCLIGFGSFNAYSPYVKSYDIHIDKKGPVTGKLKIVMASDMHFGYLSGKDHAIRMVEEINALKPDIVLFPGDIIDDDIVPYVNQGIGKVLAQIKAPYGVYASLGNHDRFKGEMKDLIALLEESNMQVLYDETIDVGGWLTLIGRKDYSDKTRAELAQLTANLNQSNPIMLLDHQPHGFDIAEKLGIDLVVSGHTHRGQIAPANLITSRIFENDWGYLRKGQLHTIVSSGFGFWGPPIRIGSQAEIVLINATFSNK
ncbi:metallophosphoesterase [Paenibacillus sp. GSMTC-2017]|uniref:metallophosphoesterase n=1 Tax=Paenibacillus sp. GSMTC-2017 TaxID=2794350 RepID=UPI0018D70664|nr:metallophosphoesterase [Paenibacillus sp. GSMTC-2017]MBH5320134.1 metallophosphoesterase [Paenibacillus sp. GSMTC-2017]